MRQSFDQRNIVVAYLHLSSTNIGKRSMIIIIVQ